MLVDGGPLKPAKEDTGALPNNGAGLAASTGAWGVGTSADVVGAPNVNGAGVAAAGSAVLFIPPNRDGVDTGSSFTDVSGADNPNIGGVELEPAPEAEVLLLEEPPNNDEGIALFERSLNSNGL